MSRSTPQEPTTRSNIPVSFVSPVHESFESDEQHHNIDIVSSEAGEPTNEAMDKAPLPPKVVSLSRYEHYADTTKSVDLGFAIGIGFGFGQEGCELEELQAEYNRKVLLRITSQVLGITPGSLKYSDDIRQHMSLDKAAQISCLTQGAVTVPDVYYASDVEHIAEHLVWKLSRVDIPFTAREEETMIELEKELCANVPFPMAQKHMTQRIQLSSFCQMLSPIFGPVLHPLFKRNMGCTMFPFFLTVSPRDAVIPSILCMFIAGSIGAGIKQILRAPRPFYIRPDLLKPRYESWGYSSPSLHSTMAACSSVFWSMRFQTPVHLLACILITVLTMISRVYLGVHWMSDVLSGAILGTSVAIVFSSDYICVGITEIFFESSNHPIYPAMGMVLVMNLIGVLQYVLYYWYGEIDANKLTFYQGNFQKLPINPGNVRKAWWSTTTASGQLMGAAIVLNDEEWCKSKYVVGSANMTNVQLVALALCYCFSLYHIIDEWRKPLRTNGKQREPIWQFAEGLYYLVFSFTTTILGGLLLGCHDYYENGSSH